MLRQLYSHFFKGLICNRTKHDILQCSVNLSTTLCASAWSNNDVVCPSMCVNVVIINKFAVNKQNKIYFQFILNFVISVHGSTYPNCIDGDIRLVGVSTDYESTKKYVIL